MDLFVYALTWRFGKDMRISAYVSICGFLHIENKSERPVDALAVEKGELIAHNLESRDARASKNRKKHSKKKIADFTM